SVLDHNPLVDGTLLRFHYCQNQEHKKDSRKSMKPGVKHRDNEGMDRFRSIFVLVEHHHPRVKYFQVDLLREALEKIHNNIWAVPCALAAKIRKDFTYVTSQQVYLTWVTLSETLWKRVEDQLESATTLLREMYEDADILQVETVAGVTALGWGLKQISKSLEGKIVAIAI
ncbi:hypothetical protein M422DRAFT_83734, partial [Sphaerobolus stellatus SS14]